MSDYKFGLVCISMEMQNQGYKFQTMTRKRFNELCALNGRDEAIHELRRRITNNLIVTEKIIRHCANKGIAAYRLSSALYPLVTDPTLDLMFLADANDIYLKAIKAAVAETNVRISTHPDQWNSLASLNPATVKQTIKELNFHGWVLDQCGAQRSYWNPINIHVGLSGKEVVGLPAIVERFLRNFEKLDDSVKSRLTLENDDKGLWTCARLIEYFQFRFPICFDEHHDAINPSNLHYMESRDCFELCVASWTQRKHPQKPLFHYSESIPGATTRLQAHADLPTRLPRQTQLLDTDEIYWDVELKGKDRAIYQLQTFAANQPCNDTKIVLD